MPQAVFSPVVSGLFSVAGVPSAIGSVRFGIPLPVSVWAEVSYRNQAVTAFLNCSMSHSFCSGMLMWLLSSSMASAALRRGDTSR